MLFGDADAWDRNASKLLERFQATGDVATLDRAIDLLRRAVQAAPVVRPDRVQRAVPIDGDRARLLSNLGGALVDRFGQVRQLSDLSEGIVVLREAIAATSTDHPLRAGFLTNLSLALRTRFDHAGALADLDESIEVGRAAVHATPADHPDHAEFLSNLGASLQIRFEQVGQLSDLHEAIDVGRAAVRAAPPSHPDRGGFLSNLSNALQVRFEQVGHRSDLAEAVEAGREAVAATPAGHPHRAVVLSNFDLALRVARDRGMAFPEDGSPNRDQVVVSVRPHWYALVGPTLKMVVVVLVAVVGVSFLSTWPETVTIRYVVVVVAVILLLRYSVPWLRWRTTQYLLTTERVVVRAGVLRRSEADIPLSRVGKVQSRSSLIENLFGCGTLIVSSRDGRDVLVLPRLPKVSDVGSTLHRLAHSAGS